MKSLILKAFPEMRATSRGWKADWRGFVHNVLGQKSLWRAQEQIIESVWHNRATAVRAGHGVGKTYAAAVAAAAFLYVFGPAKVLITAPTWWQAREVFWRAFRNIHASAPAPMSANMLETKLVMGDEWWAQVRSTREANFFQGVHARNLLVIVDEAAGVSETIFEGIKTVLTGARNRLLLLGNPTSRSGSFHAAFSDPAFNCIHVSCFDHPNVLQGRETIRGSVTREWIEERRAEWQGTPLWAARVLGEFPTQAEDQLISVDWVAAAESRDMEPKQEGPDPLRSGSEGVVAIGVDVARFGSDETAIYVMRAGGVIDQAILRRRDLMETAGHVNALALKYGARVVGVDDTGLGGGLTDRLRELGHRVMALNFGAAPDDEKRYYDLASELWGELAAGLKAGRVGPIPGNDALGAQLTARKYTYRDCRLKIESKEEMRRRGLRSPDRADALALAWRAWQVAAGLRRGRARSSLTCLGYVSAE
jgi:hypothetical protein